MTQRPYWIAQALAGEDDDAAPAPQRDTRASLCIVGGGFTGPWSAIRAKRQRPELDVVVLEADVCGAGATGRNGGCALTWSTKFFTLQRLFGDTEAGRLVRASEQPSSTSRRSVPSTRSTANGGATGPCSRPRPRPSSEPPCGRRCARIARHPFMAAPAQRC